MLPSPPSVLFVVDSGIGVGVLLCPPQLLLYLAFELLSLPLQLLSSVARRTPDRAANSALHLLRPALQSIFHAFGRHIPFVSHSPLPGAGPDVCLRRCNDRVRESWGP